MKIFKRSKKDYITFGIDRKKVSLFKKRYNIGDRIKAKVLKVVDENRAIIDIKGLKLVAYLNTKLIPPVENSYIELEVTKLSPFVQLKYIPSEGGGVSIYI